MSEGGKVVRRSGAKKTSGWSGATVDRSLMAGHVYMAEANGVLSERSASKDWGFRCPREGCPP